MFEPFPIKLAHCLEYLGQDHRIKQRVVTSLVIALSKAAFEFWLEMLYEPYP